MKKYFILTRLKVYSWRLIFFSILCPFIYGSGVYAQLDINIRKDGCEVKSLEELLGGIRKNQKIGDAEIIDCQKVTDKQFEEIGKAFINTTYPSIEDCRLMNRVMGGEGSQVLSVIRRIAGARYLGCYFDTMLFGGHEPAGKDFSFDKKLEESGDKGYEEVKKDDIGPSLPQEVFNKDIEPPPLPPPPWEEVQTESTTGGDMSSRGIINIKFWESSISAVILITVAAVIYLFVSVRKLKRLYLESTDIPLNILKTRYAKGEINKEEFGGIKKDLLS